MPAEPRPADLISHEDDIHVTLQESGLDRHGQGNRLGAVHVYAWSLYLMCGTSKIRSMPDVGIQREALYHPPNAPRPEMHHRSANSMHPEPRAREMLDRTS